MVHLFNKRAKHSPLFAEAHNLAEMDITIGMIEGVASVLKNYSKDDKALDWCLGKLLEANIYLDHLRNDTL